MLRYRDGMLKKKCMYNKQSSRSQSPTNLSAKQWQIARLPNLYQDGLKKNRFDSIAGASSR